MTDSTTELNRPFAELRRFSQQLPPPARQRCELCGLEIGAEHEHLFEPPTKKLLCCCEGCAMLFYTSVPVDQGSPAKFKRVPKRIIELPEFRLGDADWEQLNLPINLAFFFHSSVENRVVVMYPSPAGPTESGLRLLAWDKVVRQNPALADLEADTEALLVNRMSESRQHFLVPIDLCFELVGLIRLNWRGLSGGTETWQKMDEFFSGLRLRAQPLSEVHDA